MIKKIFFFIFSFIFLFSLIFVINFYFWRYNDYNLNFKKHYLKAEKELAPVVGKDLYMQIGWLAAPNRSHNFTKFPENKKDDVIRIGTFGDSFTYGDEVEDKLDYPYFLGELLGSQYEVINFGNSGWGFSQIYTFWKEMGLKYDLDIVLLGPRSFQITREKTFTTPWGRDPFLLHSIYILNDMQKLERLDINGNSILEKYQTYTQLIPSNEQLFYDYFAPASILSLVHDHGIRPNPFFRKRNIFDVFKAQVNDISSRQKTIMMLDDSSEASNFEMTPLKQLFINPFHKLLTEFPYFMVFHYSPIGNFKIAELYRDAIQGHKNKIKLLRLEKNNHKLELHKDLKIKKLDIILNGISIGTISQLNPLIETTKGHDELIELLKNHYLTFYKVSGESSLNGIFKLSKGEGSIKSEVIDQQINIYELENRRFYYKFIPYADRLLNLDELPEKGEIFLRVTHEFGMKMILLDKYEISLESY